jgi:hypothetical protein
LILSLPETVWLPADYKSALHDARSLVFKRRNTQFFGATFWTIYIFFALAANAGKIVSPMYSFSQETHIPAYIAMFKNSSAYLIGFISIKIGVG